MTVDQLTVKYGKLLQKNQYLSYTLIQLKGSVKELNMFHNYETEKKSLVKPETQQKTCNYIELFGSSARDRHASRCI